eukprot:m.169727 g.169727  ORF g.169727 m.169727 type:complete len:291 (-) comp31585_c0_seq2:1089-1961(-)
MGCLKIAQRVVQSSKNLVVLSGAGISTDSGIPDYRSPGRPPVKSIQFQDFIKKDDSRRRYWARSMLGYSILSGALPNESHKLLVQAENKNLKYIITQNVDGLHQTAGSARVLDLHGSIHDVRCMQCDAMLDRMTLQHKLVELNRSMSDSMATPVDEEVYQSKSMLLGKRPDGDAELSQDAHQTFNIPECDECGGMLKPDVVFFGENLPPNRTEMSYSVIDSADTVVVLGTSLAVWSSLRLVKRALKNGTDVIIATKGPTRADELINPDLRFEDISTTDFLEAVYGSKLED